jgi:hypothetical protein
MLIPSYAYYSFLFHMLLMEIKIDLEKKINI